MSYFVNCACGKQHAVKAMQAGASLVCGCGETVAIPPLSQLRVAAGEPPIKLTIVEQLQQALQAGELPTNNLCPLTDRAADDSLLFHVQCETVWIQESSRKDSLILWVCRLFFGFLPGSMREIAEGEDQQEFGRNTALTLPLRVSSAAREDILHMRKQAQLRELFAKASPLYVQLLTEYPDAEIGPINARC